MAVGASGTEAVASGAAVAVSFGAGAAGSVAPGAAGAGAAAVGGAAGAGATAGGSTVYSMVTVPTSSGCAPGGISGMVAGVLTNPSSLATGVASVTPPKTTGTGSPGGKPNPSTATVSPARAPPAGETVAVGPPWPAAEFASAVPTSTNSIATAATRRPSVLDRARLRMGPPSVADGPHRTPSPPRDRACYPGRFLAFGRG